jgi:redox-sensitive bicupin YhaK (pirin superfamily)
LEEGMRARRRNTANLLLYIIFINHSKYIKSNRVARWYIFKPKIQIWVNYPNAEKNGAPTRQSTQEEEMLTDQWPLKFKTSSVFQGLTLPK